MVRRARSLREAVTRHLRPRRLVDADNQRLLDQFGRHHARGNLLRFLEDPRVPPTNNGSSRNRVGNFVLLRVSKPLFFPGETSFPHCWKLVTMRGWANSSDSRMSTASLASSRWPECGVSLVTHGRWSSRSTAAEKN